MSLTQINKAGLDEIALDHVFTIGASGSSAYTFQGEGLNGTVNNPTLYLTRGKTYRFENGSGGHPIRIQSTSGASGTAYNTGVTNNAGSGTVIVEVQHDAPDVLYYQCTSHAAMNGILYITGALADGGVTTAKIADDAVTNDKLANSVVASIAANTAKTSNATHTGDVTGSTSLTIANNAVTTAKIADQAVTTVKLANDAVDYGKLADGAVLASKLATNSVQTAKIADQAVTLAKLPHGTSSNNGKFLRANNGADPSFETVNTDLVADSSPQLGAALDTNGYNINFGDSTGNGNAVNRLTFGTLTHGDLQIYHDGSNSYITDRGTGELRLYAAETLRIRDTDSGEEMITCNKNGSVDLYYNNEKKLFTTPQGVDVQAEGSAVELKLLTDGGTTRGWVYANNSNQIGILDIGGDWAIRHTNDSQTEFFVQTNRKVAIDADGLKFGNDTAAANALDDYEEGSWTPTVGQGTVSVHDCRYTKVGRLCTIQGRIDNFSNNSSSSTLTIGNLPFTAGVTNVAVGSCFYHYVGTQHATTLYINSSSGLEFYGGSNGNWSYLQYQNLSVSGGSTAIYFTATYQTT